MRYFSDNIVRDVLTNYSHAEESTFGVKYFLGGGLGAFVLSVLADVGTVLCLVLIEASGHLLLVDDSLFIHH